MFSCASDGEEGGKGAASKEGASAPGVEKLGIALTVDARGKFCPVPIVELSRALKQLEPGALVELLATDPGARGDLEAFCRATRQSLLSLSESDGTLRALVKKS